MTTPERGLSLRLMMFAVLALGMALGGLAPFFRTLTDVDLISLALTILIFFAMLAPVIIVTVITLFFRARRQRRISLAGVLSIASDRGIPLAESLKSFAENVIPHKWFRGPYRKILFVSERLEQGMPFSEAVEITGLGGVLPKRSMPMIRMGEASGQLPRAFSVIRENHFRPSPLGSYPFYLIVLSIVLLNFNAFLATYIFPKILKIIEDFGVDRETDPWLSNLFAWTDFLRYSPNTLFLILACQIIFLIWFMRFSQRLSLPTNRGILLEGLAMGVSAGMPIPTALNTLAASWRNGKMQKTLVAARKAVEQGTPWIAALGKQRLLRPIEAALLATAERAGNLEWALREAARNHERNRQFRIAMWAQSLFPFFMILIGVFVMISVTLYFYPLIAIIHKMVFIVP